MIDCYSILMGQRKLSSVYTQTAAAAVAVLIKAQQFCAGGFKDCTIGFIETGLPGGP
jgi:hypothetical protein